MYSGWKVIIACVGVWWWFSVGGWRGGGRKTCPREVATQLSPMCQSHRHRLQLIVLTPPPDIWFITVNPLPFLLIETFRRLLLNYQIKLRPYSDVSRTKTMQHEELRHSFRENNLMSFHMKKVMTLKWVGNFLTVTKTTFYDLQFFKLVKKVIQYLIS